MTVQRTMLVTRGLNLAYGSRQVVRDFSIEVNRGECVALIGANGAGKSTARTSIVGIHSVEDGVVTFDDRDVTNWSPAQAVAAGVVLCPEGRHLFPEMSIRDNLLLGAAKVDIGRKELKTRIARVETLFPKLHERRDQMAGTLSGGEQQMVALARALMSAPQLLILDEPTLGLAPLMVETVFELVRNIVGTGTSVLIAEQNVTATLQAADRVYVMEAGKLISHGTAKDMRDDPSLIAALMGV